MPDDDLDQALTGLNRQRSAGKPVVLVIAGPTASGKSATAIQVAQAVNGEILSADSMQLYKGMDIGTAKVSAEEQRLVPHHMIDLLEPEQRFSVAAWQSVALKVIDEVLSRDRVPIVCGGTGQYISALMEGLTFTPVPGDPDLRARLNTRADEEGPDRLLAEIASFDPATAARLHEKDRKRIVRALEVYLLTGLTPTEINLQSRCQDPAHQYIGFCLSPDRAVLYERINRRVDQMMAGGLIEEVRKLALQDLPDDATCRQAIGYKEVFQYLEGTSSLEAVAEQIKLSTRHYAKRQMTWFRRMPQLTPVFESDPEAAAKFILQNLSISDKNGCCVIPARLP